VCSWIVIGIVGLVVFVVVVVICDIVGSWWWCGL